MMFLSLFSYTFTIIPWMFLFFFLKKNSLKILLTFILIYVYITLGFRFAIIVLFLSYLISKLLLNKHLNIVFSLLIIIAIVILILIIPNIRGFFKRGEGINFSSFSVRNLSLENILDFDLGIYKGYYRIIEEYPEHYKFTLGRQISYTFLYVIPRVFWKNKPEHPPLREVLYNVFGLEGVQAGYAWPHFGEYYSEFGLFGIILFNIFLGIFYKKLRILILNYSNFINVFVYSFLVSASFQIITRGYTAANFWFMIFGILPVLIVNFINSLIYEVKR